MPMASTELSLFNMLSKLMSEKFMLLRMSSAKPWRPTSRSRRITLKPGMEKELEGFKRVSAKNIMSWVSDSFSMSGFLREAPLQFQKMILTLEEGVKLGVLEGI